MCVCVCASWRSRTAFHLHCRCRRCRHNKWNVSNGWKANDKIKLKSFNYLVKMKTRGAQPDKIRVFPNNVRYIETFLDLLCLYTFWWLHFVGKFYAERSNNIIRNPLLHPISFRNIYKYVLWFQMHLIKVNANAIDKRERERDSCSSPWRRSVCSIELHENKNTFDIK